MVQLKMSLLEEIQGYDAVLVAPVHLLPSKNKKDGSDCCFCTLSVPATADEIIF
jgi:hypothetical protein